MREGFPKDVAYFNERKRKWVEEAIATTFQYNTGTQTWQFYKAAIKEVRQLLLSIDTVSYKDFYPIGVVKYENRFIIYDKENGFLGRGASADVYAALELNEKNKARDCVIKEMGYADPHKLETYTRYARTEVRVYNKLKEIAYTVRTESNVVCILPRYYGIPLSSLLSHSKGSDGPNYLQRLTLIISLLTSLRDLHRKLGIIHGDIKPDNLIVDSIPEDPFVETKIIDFAHVRTIGEKIEKIAGSVMYLSPEEFMKEGIVSYSMDIWSALIVVLNILGAEETLRTLFSPKDDGVTYGYNLFRHNGFLPPCFAELGRGEGAKNGFIVPVYDFLRRKLGPDKEERKDINPIIKFFVSHYEEAQAFRNCPDQFSASNGRIQLRYFGTLADKGEEVWLMNGDVYGAAKNLLVDSQHIEPGKYVVNVGGKEYIFDSDSDLLRIKNGYLAFYREEIRTFSSPKKALPFPAAQLFSDGSYQPRVLKRTGRISNEREATVYQQMYGFGITLCIEGKGAYANVLNYPQGNSLWEWLLFDPTWKYSERLTIALTIAKELERFHQANIVVSLDPKNIYIFLKYDKYEGYEGYEGDDASVIDAKVNFVNFPPKANGSIKEDIIAFGNLLEKLFPLSRQNTLDDLSEDKSSMLTKLIEDCKTGQLQDGSNLSNEVSRIMCTSTEALLLSQGMFRCRLTHVATPDLTQSLTCNH